MKVIHLISGLFFGGGQKVVLDLLSPPTDNPLQLLATLGDQPGSILSKAAQFTIPYNGKYSKLSTLIPCAMKLRGIMAREKPAILHTHGLDADLIGGMASLALGVRHIAHLHITPPVDRQNSPRTWIRRKTLNWLTRANGTTFVAVSEAVRQEMANFYKIPLHRIRTIRNGIDMKQYLLPTRNSDRLLDPSKVVIGSAGRLMPMKGFADLIEAVAILHSRGTSVRLKIAGSGSQLEELKSSAQAKGIAGSVEFMGNVASMGDFYRTIDAFVLASVSTEGLPLVILEAMAAGLPIVATNVGGASEAVRNGIDGQIVPPKDPNQLADAIDKLVRSPEAQRSMGDSARQRVEEEFSLNRVKSELRQLYQDVAAVQ